MPRYTKAERDEAMEALLTAAHERASNGLSVCVSDWCSGRAWSLAMQARRAVAIDTREDKNGPNNCHLYAAAASLLDAGWSP